MGRKMNSLFQTNIKQTSHACIISLFLNKYENNKIIGVIDLPVSKFGYLKLPDREMPLKPGKQLINF
jgi:hypothetical protein